MFAHYLKMALRVFLRNRLYSVVNVAGLALGLASAMLLLLYIKDETSYDNFWPGVDNLYMLQTTIVQQDGAKAMRGQAPYLASEALRLDFADEIEGASFTFLGLTRPLMVDDRQISAKLSFVERDYPQMYDLTYLEGNANSAVTGPNSAALSVSSAKKFFGDTAPYLGKTFRAPSLDRDFVVSAVYEDVPTNSSHVLDVMVEFQMDDWTDGMQAGMSGSWSYLIGDVYVRLKSGVDPAVIERKLPEWLDKHSPPLSQFPDRKPSEILSFRLANIKDVHLSEYSPFSVSAVDPVILWGMAALGLIVLTIASVNFVNLSLAQAIRREKEVALRKVLGSNRSQLVAQFVGEAVGLSLAGLVLAMALVDVALPWFETLVAHEMSVSIYDWSSIGLFLLLAFVLGLLAGIYPALVLSSARPGKALGSGRGITGKGGKLSYVLVVLQFAVAVALSIATIMINQQLRHSQSLETGYDKKGLVSLVIGTGEGMFPNYEAFMTRLEALPDVQTMAHGGGLPVRPFIRTTRLTPAAFEAAGEIEVGVMGVGYDYFSTMGVPMLAGRELQELFAPDEESLVISMAAAKAFGFSTPAASIGQTVKLREQTYAIVGVVPDLRLVSSKQHTPPMVYYAEHEFAFSLLARVNDVAASTFTRDLEVLWQEFYPDRPMNLRYADEALADLYSADRQTRDMLSVFSALALVVSGMGLFALAAFSAERRTKEAGIRKVLGASVVDIAGLMIWQFSKPVILANLIAWPLVAYAMEQWLQSHAERISLSPSVFFAAGSAVLVLAWLTVTVHALRVARQNPVHSLRYQ